MAASDDHIALAGEYVLGTLSAEERLEAQNLIGRDHAFAEVVSDWERILAVISLTVRAIAPSAALRQRVLAQISGSATGGDVVSLKRKLNVWRGLTVAATAVAAALAAFIVLRPMIIPPPAGSYVAVLQDPNSPGPAFVASIDIGDGTISVRRVGAETQTSNSYELWAVGGGRAQPESLGVIDASLKIPASQLGKVDAATLDQTVFAISLEPLGGSPTGQPTQVLYTGKLVATE